MRTKYIGLTPVSNKFGDWKRGDVRNLPSGVKLGEEFIDLDVRADVVLIKPMDAQVANKMEKKNRVYYHGREAK